jgi:hypothetical protein
MCSVSGLVMLSRSAVTKAILPVVAPDSETARIAEGRIWKAVVNQWGRSGSAASSVFLLFLKNLYIFWDLGRLYELVMYDAVRFFYTGTDGSEAVLLHCQRKNTFLPWTWQQYVYPKRFRLYCIVVLYNTISYDFLILLQCTTINCCALQQCDLISSFHLLFNDQNYFTSCNNSLCTSQRTARALIRKTNQFMQDKVIMDAYCENHVKRTSSLCAQYADSLLLDLAVYIDN